MKIRRISETLVNKKPGKYSKRKDYDEISEEISKDLIISILDTIDDKISENTEPEIDFLIFITDAKRPEPRYDYVTYLDYEAEESICCVGYMITFKYPVQGTLSVKDILSLKNFIDIIYSISKRLSDNYDCICHSRIEPDSERVVIIIRKIYPAKVDYYYILGNEISNYIDGWFTSSQIIKKESDFYLEIKTLERMDKKAQAQKLADFMGSAFEDITFDEFIFVDENTFMLKNPKMESIDLHI